MSFVEGIGDEVVLLFGFIFILILLIIGWKSTSVANLSFDILLSSSSVESGTPTDATLLDSQRSDDSGILPSESMDPIYNCDFSESVNSVNDVQSNSNYNEERCVDESSGFSLETQDQHTSTQCVCTINSDSLEITDSSFVMEKSNTPDLDVQTGESDLHMRTSLGANAISSRHFQKISTNFHIKECSNTNIQIRLLYTNATSRIVQVTSSCTIDELRRLHFTDELAANKSVRFIFRGKLLGDDSRSLDGYDIVDDTTIHCLVREQSQRTPSQGHNTEFLLGSGVPARFSFPYADPGNLFVPLVGLMLSILWYFRITFRHHFTLSSTCLLILLSLCYLFGVGVVFRLRILQRLSGIH